MTGVVAAALGATSDAARRVTADVAMVVTPTLFLPMIMKSGIDNRLWVVSDGGIVYLDLVVESCNVNRQCVIKKG